MGMSRALGQRGLDMSTSHEYVSPVAWVGPHRELVIVVSLVGASLLGVPPAGVRRVRGLDPPSTTLEDPGIQFLVPEQ